MSTPPAGPGLEDGPALREYTFRAFVLATLLTVLFGVASGYLGLKVGTTFAASIPAAVMSLAVLRGLFRDAHLLESNMVQTQASAGESIMGAVVYIVPALIFLELRPSVLSIGLMTLAGGLLGIFIMVPLRDYFIRDQSAVLPYPEGVACASVLTLGERGAAAGARHVFTGMGIGGLYNLVTADGLRLFSGQAAIVVERLGGLTLGLYMTPLVLGIGFISGYTVGLTMLGGALLKGVVALPALGYFTSTPAGPAAGPRIEFCVRMIGAGAVATGGFLAIFRMAPDMLTSLRGGLTGLASRRAGAARSRTEQDLPAGVIVSGIAAGLGFTLWSLWLAGRSSPGGLGSLGLLLGLVLTSVLACLFVALCARLVGLVGTSNYPLSGMTIGALLVAVVVLKAFGVEGPAGMTAAIVIGTVICIAIAITADLSQDLKTGALVGATPYRQQLGQVAGVLITALVAGFVVLLFDRSGELARVPAPQARMMAAIVQGVMTAEFEWRFVALGAAAAVAAELAGISAIMLAVGFYLPVPIASAFVVGGILRRLFDRRHGASEAGSTIEREGVLLASGLIAGWALMGVALVLLVALREFKVIATADIALASLPPPGASLAYVRDLSVTVAVYGVLIYHFGRVLRLWQPRGPA